MVAAVLLNALKRAGVASKAASVRVRYHDVLQEDEK